MVLLIFITLTDCALNWTLFQRSSQRVFSRSSWVFSGCCCCSTRVFSSNHSNLPNIQSFKIFTVPFFFDRGKIEKSLYVVGFLYSQSFSVLLCLFSLLSKKRIIPFFTCSHILSTHINYTGKVPKTFRTAFAFNLRKSLPFGVELCLSGWKVNACHIKNFIVSHSLRFSLFVCEVFVSLFKETRWRYEKGKGGRSSAYSNIAVAKRKTGNASVREVGNHNNNNNEKK